ncbi:EF-hand calcium-binding domain-containing protein 6-like [Centruroides sculpturatus]|uniref:EF-hand calcium-binding domain-containing protein 6-like n=1 Tax=Centruroides sculpturatus TaxID=218467 RepID=UPI000C6E94E2|nr:EF-hand calcium-binding domain-containing protein 6-like [Centruroides sculpturatus]
MAKFQNPRWESVPACLVWPDIDYEESLQRSHQKQTNETGETAVKRLRVRAINPHNSLKVAYTVNRNGDKMITREEMKRVANFSMPYPAKLSAKDYEELLLILDPLHTNLIKLEDFLNLFKPESVCDLGNSIKKVSTSSLQRHEPLTLLKLDEKIRYNIKTQTEKLLKAFTFYDFENTGMVSKQHVKCLLQKHCMPLSDKQFEGLWKMFPVENGALNYIRFLDFGDCTPNNSISNYRIKTISRTLVHSSSKSKYDEPSIQKLRNTSKCHCEIEGNQFNDIKIILRNCIEKNWHDIIRKCKEADPRQSGRIASESMKEVLNQCGIPVYSEFMNNFLERQYNMVPGTLILNELPVLHISNNSYHRSQALRQQFLANDPQKAGLIDATKFKKILNDFTICLSDEDFFIICKHFDPVLSGSIPYVNFLQSFAHPNF